MSRINIVNGTVFGLPETRTNIKIDIYTVASMMGILSNISDVEDDDPETFKKLQMWSKLIHTASDEQLDRIIPPHVTTIITLLISLLGTYRKAKLQQELSEGVEIADHHVQMGRMNEGQYKTFCDVSMWMINLLKIIDEYSKDENTFDIGATGRYITHKGRKAFDIIIFSP